MDRPYIYESLSSPHHIRVLTLAPSGDPGAALESSIEQVHIDDPCKEYEAISYTWGGQERTEDLLCDRAIIKITPNLAAALSHLRYRTRPRRLWADAICINQEDLTEKAQQIPLMARIFQAATQVKVWLGDGTDGESRALADLASLDHTAGSTRTSLKHPLTSRHDDEDSYQALVDIGRSAKKILRMPWFGRRWIVQELVLNGNVVFHCGQARISWQGLHTALHALPDDAWHQELDFLVRRKLGQLRDLWRTWCYANSSTMDCRLYSLLHSFHDLECKEPKDRIYAIAALAEDVELKQQTSSSSPGVVSITPDYKTSDEKVFQDLAFNLIQSGKVFSTLAHAGASRIMKAKSPLPSWVPDVREPGAWPLIAVDKERDFKLVDVLKPVNGFLTMNIKVYGSKRCTSLESIGQFYHVDMRPSLSPRHSHSMVKWRPLLVGRVFNVGESGIALSGNKLQEDINNYITHYLMDMGYKEKIHGHPRVFPEIYHMLWSIIRSHFLTETGPESLDRLGSIDEWRELFSSWKKGEPNKCQWALDNGLANALFTRTIFHGTFLSKAQENDPECLQTYLYFGFGPRGLSPGDAIFISSSKAQAATALFLRPEGTGCKNLGGGLVWVRPRWAKRHIDLDPFSELTRCLIELRIA